ncbi:Zinc/iron permease [Eremomyces bilateralis CBS 781.70]|uniref:Zinc/iron permease n=1 Tax=Eremomyces bilateralis CBS 781.70 TaxID=1392243 RepID=A0A6G1FSI5_9PEZI|nr:Zinc/iron permease [Eremomyces bilateralis CBS 781.70]KAF1808825.1 Zinc/iron permease [Eremomyces bilateralis CBS 781.70]
MWDGLFLLLSLSGAMGAASFLAGLLPLSFSLTKRQLRLISALGTGILVGTALIVIIPEGIETLYSASANTRKSSVQPGEGATRGGQGALSLHTFDNIGLDADRDEPEGFRGPKHLKPDVRSTDEYIRSIGKRDWRERGKTESKGKDLDSTTSKDEEMKSSDPHEVYDSIPKTDTSSPHTWISISLILGFSLMYLIDALPKLGASRPRAPMHISLSDLSQGLHPPSPTAPSTPFLPVSPQSHSPQTTTFGLLIHALADGVALGAASASSSQPTKPGSDAAHHSLTVMIFLAILIHKAPAAFGLVALLLKRGASKRTARSHLLVFSLAAPMGALLAWCAISTFGSWGTAAGGESNGQWWTGCVLIFSGGTFLYVATHSLSEATNGLGAVEPHELDLSNPYSSANGDGMGNGHAYDGYSKSSGSNLTRTEIGCTLLGMFLPLIALAGEGGHGH